DSLINNRDRFFRSRVVLFLLETFAWPSASDEFNVAFTVFAAALRAEFFLKDWEHRPVELFRLGDAHAMHLKADDGEARSRKHFDHTARSQIWELEIVGLNQDECLFDLRVRRKTDGAIQNAAVGIR